MRKLCHILLTTIAIFSVFAKVSIATAAPSACGVDERCKDGYYCVGAIGQSASGVCIPNALNITMCRAIDFVQKDIFKYFILFASIFAGLYMFIGKFAIVTLAQIIIGIAVLVGAPVIIANVLGSDQVCNVENAKSCLLDGIKNVTAPSKNHQTVRNLSPTKDDYTGKDCDLLGCVKARCEQYRRMQNYSYDRLDNHVYNNDQYFTKKEVDSNFYNTKETSDLKCKIAETPDRPMKNIKIAINTESGNVKKNIPECKYTCKSPTDIANIKGDQKQQYQDSQIYYANKPPYGKKYNPTTKKYDKDGDEYRCIESPINVSCKIVQAKFVRDYFICENSCNGAKFAAEAPSNQNIADCKNLIKKNVKYK